MENIARNTTNVQASVLMCVYNEKPHNLSVAIKSILNQTFRSFEFIIIDDGSDNIETIRLLDEYSKNDDRIVVFHEQHRGLTKSLNIGLNYCQSDIVFRQDSDDWSNADRIEQQLGFLERSPDTVLLGSAMVLHKENEDILWECKYPLSHEEILNSMQIGNAFCHGSVCFRKDIVVREGGYREILKCSQDYDLFWRLSEKYLVSNLSQVLYHYRCCASSITSKTFSEKIDTNRFIKKMANFRASNLNEDEAFNIYNFSRKITPDAILYNGDRYMLAGKYYDALKIYLQAICFNVFNIKSWIKLMRLGLFVFLGRHRYKLFDHGFCELSYPK